MPRHERTFAHAKLVRRFLGLHETRLMQRLGSKAISFTLGELEVNNDSECDKLLGTCASAYRTTHIYLLSVFSIGLRRSHITDTLLPGQSERSLRMSAGRARYLRSYKS